MPSPQAAAKRLLSDVEDAVQEDVAPLLKAVVATNRFEREMAAAFGNPTSGGGGSRGGANGDEDEDKLDGDGDSHGGDSLPAAEARKRLEAFRRRQQAEAAARAANANRVAGSTGTASPGGGGGGSSCSSSPVACATSRGAANVSEMPTAADAAARVAFEGAISSAFEDALHYYVAEEQREVRWYMWWGCLCVRVRVCVCVFYDGCCVLAGGTYKGGTWLTN